MALAVQLLLVTGGLLVGGLVVDTLGRNRFVPRVTLLIGLGVLVGPSGLHVLPAVTSHWFNTFATVALVMVGFLLGERFTLAQMRNHGREVVWISLGASLGTALTVGTGLLLCGAPLSLSVLLAGIAASTAPAATVDVVRETKNGGDFSDKLLGAVALDDAWGLILFSLCAAFAMMLQHRGDPAVLLIDAGIELGGAILLGVALGLPAAYLSGRIAPGEPSLIEALGIVFVCGGLALWMNLSFLIAAMTLGAVVANLARHHDRPFHQIEGIEGPFLIVFFILAGASLEMTSLAGAPLLFAAYIGFRLLGKWIGGWSGARVAGSNAATQRWIGLAMTPQAGIAIGMALIAINRFPEYEHVLLPTILGSTVVFELTGPVLTRAAIRKAHRQ